MQASLSGSSTSANVKSVGDKGSRDSPLSSIEDRATNSVKQSEFSSRRSSIESISSRGTFSVSLMGDNATNAPSVSAWSDLAQFLTCNPLFIDSGASQDNEFIQNLAKSMHLRHFQPGDHICREGEMGRAMFFLVRGIVSVSSKDGETVYAELGPGSFFGGKYKHDL
jgi:hypothetical protein